MNYYNNKTLVPKLLLSAINPQQTNQNQLHISPPFYSIKNHTFYNLHNENVPFILFLLVLF